MVEIVRDEGEKIVQWVCRGVDEHPALLGGIFLTLGFVRGGKLVGGLIWHGLTGREVWWTLYTTTPAWCTRRVLNFCFDLAFNRLKLKRINLLISRSNARSLDFCTRLGFRIEGLKRQARENGEDAFMLGMLNTECKFLRRK